MEEKVLNTEEVLDGDYAVWPWKTGEGGYEEPALPGCVFVGWEFNGVTYPPPYNKSSNPFGKIEEDDVKIVAKWNTFHCLVDTNHSIVGFGGDSDSELTELKFWASSDEDGIITEGVTIKTVQLADGMLPIVFDDRGTSVISGKNVKKIKVKANDKAEYRYYRFKAVYKGLESETIEIKQIAGRNNE
jgi:hypothetical protein